jgi:hypothetical protein
MDEQQKLSIESPSMNLHTVLEHALKLEAMIRRIGAQIGVEIGDAVFSLEGHIPNLVGESKPDTFFGKGAIGMPEEPTNPAPTDLEPVDEKLDFENFEQTEDSAHEQSK